MLLSSWSALSFSPGPTLQRRRLYSRCLLQCSVVIAMFYCSLLVYYSTAPAVQQYEPCCTYSCTRTCWCFRTRTYGLHRTCFACFSLPVPLYSYLPLQRQLLSVFFMLYSALQLLYKTELTLYVYCCTSTAALVQQRPVLVQQY